MPRRRDRHRCSTPGLVYQTGTASVSGNTYTASFAAQSGDYDGSSTVTLAADVFQDDAGNGNLPAQSASVNTDNIAPVISGFNASGNGIYGPGDTVEIVAQSSEPLQAGAAIRVTLSNGEDVTLTVTSAGSNQLRGDYTVAADDTSDGDLDVAKFPASRRRRR